MSKKKAEKCRETILQRFSCMMVRKIKWKEDFTYLRRWFARYERELKQ